ncbi:MBG domain-containing protein [Mucilaginibacter endophyticus]|uniref:MBG domain-containing protein n=1 Tax=Mucilaginibacter endophyticus TaxID=2675003 RepID=UPI00137A56C2|nr:MBG domain-containing protein [Mucilaginibacter endophyticus]
MLTRAGAQGNQHIKSGEHTTAVNFPAGGCVYSWENDKPDIGLAATGNGNIPSFTAINNGTTPITATIKARPLSSDFAYVANYGSNNVSVVSTLSNTVIATIPVGTKPFGVSVNPNSTLVYITNEGSNSVSVINTLTNAVTATIPVGQNPRGVAVSPDGKRVYVTNFGENSVSVINALTNTVISTITVGQSPYGVAVTPDGSKLYVANYNSNTVSAVNTSTGNVIATMQAQSNPLGVAISPDGTRVYVTNFGFYTITAINATNNTVIDNFSAATNPTALTVSADGSRVYFTNNSGYFCFLIPATREVFQEATAGRSLSLSVTPDGSFIYIVDAANDAVDYAQLTNTYNGGQVIVGSSPYSFGNFIAKGPGCGGQPITFTITVDPPPVITVSAVSGIISACEGTPSASPEIEQFTVSGSGLSADIVATAPAGFELSLAPAGSYGNTITFSQAGGLLSSKTIYVRSAASAVGHISGNVTLSSSGITYQNVSVAGNINKLPTVNAVSNQVVFAGDATTPVNFTGTGNTFTWVNDKTSIGLPANGTGNISSFTAVNHTGSPVKATITVTPVPGPAYAYTANQNANTVSVINLENNSVVATIPVGVQPTGVAVSPDGKRVYVTNQNLIGPSTGNTVSVIDVASNTVITNITVNERPYGIAISPDGSRLYVTSQSPFNTVSVINTATNTVLKILPSGGVNPQSLVVSPDGTRLYVTNNLERNVVIFNTATYEIVGSAQAQGWPLGIGVTPDNKFIYVANYFSNTVSVIDASTYSTLYEISVGEQPTGLVISAAGDLTYVANASSSTVSVINNRTHTVITSIPVGTFPRGISLSGDGTKLYVSNQGSKSVSVINTLNNSVSATINIDGDPYSFGSFVTPTSLCTGNATSFNITVKPIPDITATPPLQAVNTTYGTPSAPTSFTVSGTNLSTGILVTAPDGFELSMDNVTFTNTVTVGSAGSLNGSKIYIRLKSTTDAGAYAGNILLSSTGAPAITVPMPVSKVTPTPITVTANDISKVYGSTLNNNPSSTAFIVAAGGLKNGNTITSVSLTYGTGAEPTAGVGVYQSIIPAVNTGTNGFLPGNYTIAYILGNIKITPAPLTITAVDVNKPFGTILTEQTGSTAFISSGLQNQENIGSVTITYGSGAAANDPIGVYPAAITPSLASGGTFNPANYLITYNTGKITVTPPVAIIASGTISAVNTIYGTPSTSTIFTISGNGLPAGILVTPPTGFEVSIDNSGFHPFITLGQGGNIAATTVYIRLAAKTPAGIYNGDILLSSGSITATQFMPNSKVNPTPLTITADNKTKVAGMANPELTVTYTGFVNNETAAQLIVKPMVTTLATALSVAGQYPINATGAMSPNYTISYVDGILTINALPPKIVVPNIFTPNGDGANDLWVISSLEYYPGSTVSVYNRLGQQLYHSVGYSKPWDGTYHGAGVPSAVYYYIIEPAKNKPVLSGYVTVVR